MPNSKHNSSLNKPLCSLTDMDTPIVKVDEDIELDVSLDREPKWMAMPHSTQDLLIEIGTEELPPGHIQELAQSFAVCVKQSCYEMGLKHGETQSYSSPRRLALILKAVWPCQSEQTVKRRGPLFEKAFDSLGKPTLAGLGFMRSCGFATDIISSLLESLHSDGIGYDQDHRMVRLCQTDKGVRLHFEHRIKGRSAVELIPELVQSAIDQLPLSQSMRWGDQSIAFIRPVRWVVLLYGDQWVEANLLGVKTQQTTYGHRFHHPEPITLKHAKDYVQTLKQAYVMVDPQERMDDIVNQIKHLVGDLGRAIVEDDLLKMVNDLVEYPQALLGQFDARFLDLPDELLISVMRKHQRCFPVGQVNGKMTPYFVVISNIKSCKPDVVVKGNVRVMEARLADAAFFFETDSRCGLDRYLEDLKQVVFQKQLGSLYDSAVRVSDLAGKIVDRIETHAKVQTNAKTQTDAEIQTDVGVAKRAGLLAKADLQTCVVEEFPELQGVMGYYYALKQTPPEPPSVAWAIKEFRYPYQSKSPIPSSPVGCAVALADRLDILVGFLGIHQSPTGDKDPFALRRAALGVVRIIIMGGFSLDLSELLTWTALGYGDKLTNAQVVSQSLDFIFERLRFWYLDQKVEPSILASVFARSSTDLLDFDRRIRGMTHFCRLPESKSLVAAHKRVSHFLRKAETQYALDKKHKLDESLLQMPAEKYLAESLQLKSEQVTPLLQNQSYTQALELLAGLQAPIDRFFNEVLVMVEDEALKRNRLVLLVHLRELFLQVADIALLQPPLSTE